MEKYCINLDWFEAYCFLSDDLLIEGVNGRTERRGYIIERQIGGGGRTFKHHYVIYQGGKEIASFVCAPYSSVIKKRAALVKLHNRLLYSQNWLANFECICNAVGFNYKGISRLDVAYDCNYFKFHRDPAKFIKDYVSVDFESPAYIHRKGGNKFALRGRKYLNKEQVLNYITWGAEKSRLRAYIYDKTLELKEVHDKPWIRDTWELNGIDYTNGAQVWRSEISIGAQGFDLLDYDSGDLFRLSPDFLESQQRIEDLFYIYAEKALSFSRRGNYKRIRDFRPVPLFEGKKSLTVKSFYDCQLMGSGRTEKVCSNLLKKIACTYTDLCGQYNKSIADVIEILEIIRGAKDIDYKSTENAYAIEHMKGITQLFTRTNRDYRGFQEVFKLASKLPSELLYACFSPEEKNMYEYLNMNQDQINEVLAREFKNMQMPEIV